MVPGGSSARRLRVRADLATATVRASSSTAAASSCPINACQQDPLSVPGCGRARGQRKRSPGCTCPKALGSPDNPQPKIDCGCLPARAHLVQPLGINAWGQNGYEQRDYGRLGPEPVQPLRPRAPDPPWPFCPRTLGALWPGPPWCLGETLLRKEANTKVMLRKMATAGRRRLNSHRPPPIWSPSRWAKYHVPQHPRKLS